MISAINNSSLAYTPASRSSVERVTPEVKEINSLQTQSAQSINTSRVTSSKLQVDQAAQSSDSTIEGSKEQQLQVRQVVDQLKSRDREVRTHEMAHLSAAGSYAIGGMSLSYQRGPDGQQYAIGGSVQINTSAISGDPEASLQKGQAVQQAALAPAEPSNQDRKVASAAAQMITSSQFEILKMAQEERSLKEGEGVDKTEDTDLTRSGSSSKIRPNDEESELSSLNASKKNPYQGLNTMENMARMQFDVRMQVAAG